MNPPLTERYPGFREETYGRRLESMRWHQGKLQMGFAEKFSQYEGRRLVTSGERTVWENVPGDPPAAVTQTTAPPSASAGSGC